MDEIIEASAALDDERKALAEIMENKLWGIGHSSIEIALKHDQNNELGVHGWAHWMLQHILATFDTLIAAWRYKRMYEAVRPVTAVRHVYGRAEADRVGRCRHGHGQRHPGRRVGALPADR